MVKIRIDNKVVEAKENSTVITAARNAGINIPSMCYLEGKEHITSCMICMVKDRKSDRLFPSCSVKVSEGMDIISMDDEIYESRKTALELLLSEHVGDCEAPCTITCPAHMNIPLMNRLLSEAKFREALEVVMKDIALPAVFGYVCPAPCEGACHRKTADEAVSICLLKRFAGEYDLKREPDFIDKEDDKNKSVAIIGAGPAGLATAYYLCIMGYECSVYDRREKAGGSLHNEVESGKLPLQILEKETGFIEKAGVKFFQNTTIDHKKFEELRNSFDALVIATGQGKSGIENWGLKMTDKGIHADNSTFHIENSKIFVAGSALKPSRMAIRAHGQGKEAAFSIKQFLEGEKVTGVVNSFNSRFGKLKNDEIAEYLKEAGKENRQKPRKNESGFSAREVILEASRCMHCDCRDLKDCSLRIYSDEYKADQKRFKSRERKKIIKHFQHDSVIYEPAKCIRCGICVNICTENSEELGLSFIGRGFDIEVGIPFNEDLKEGLKTVAAEVVENCPVGALAWKEGVGAGNSKQEN